MAHHDDDRWPSLAAELERLHRLAVPVPVPRVPHTDEDVGARINPGEIRELDVYWNAAINTRAAPAFPNLDDEVPISDTESVDIPQSFNTKQRAQRWIRINKPNIRRLTLRSSKKKPRRRQ